jgi:fibro-slime domain-containing protein
VERCSDGEWQACDAPQPKPPVLEAMVRDFLDTHPDFEAEDVGEEPDIVADRLGDDGKPVYANPGGRTETTSGQAGFDQWYRDVAGVNQSMTITVPLVPSGAEGVFGYDNGPFFPVDGQLFGNQGRRHNYHFTLELHTEFRYKGGEVFSFTGDDDLWLFVNGWLAIDLGGTHTQRRDSVSLDQRAGEFGIEQGGIYAFDLFFAERHTIHSNFHIETTISEFANCD